MEAKTWKSVLITSLAPVAWGTTYFVTRQYLPSGLPLWGSVLRALPAGLLLWALTRKLPRRDWWWRSAVISALTIGGFFVLVYLAGQLLPSGVAAMIMAGSPALTLVLAWLLVGERVRVTAALGAIAGAAGVALLIGAGLGALDHLGVLASLAAMGSSTLGFVLAKRWQPPVDATTFASWQLLFGGVMLVPVAMAFEGWPPVPSTSELLAFGYLTLVATAAAYAAWFHGLAHLPAGTVGLIGLLNPLAGTALGVFVAGELFSPLQIVGAVLVVAGVGLGLVRPRRSGRVPRAKLWQVRTAAAAGN